MDSDDVFLCRFVFSDIFSVMMGVWTDDRLEALVGESLSFDDDLGMAIWERVGDRDLTIGGCAMMCCFVDGEDSAEEEGSIF